MNSIINEKNRQNSIINHNLTDITSNLKREYIKKKDLSNKQVEIIEKYKYLNNLLLNRIKHYNNVLNSTENNINIRESLIRTNENSFNYKNKELKSITTIFILFGYLILTVTTYFSKKISFNALLINIIMIVILYLIYLSWFYNLLGLKNFFNFSVKEFDKAKNNIYIEGRQIENSISDYVNNCNTC